MKTYYFKTKDKFIASIYEGTKKYDYRLALPERLQIKVGDTIVLISNQDKKKFVRTTVKNITIYKDWKEALQDNWQQVFQTLYSSLEEALKDCYRFYPKEKVDKYGIVSFEIAPLKVDYCNTSVLLDTNIIIKRESSNNATFEVSTLFNWFDKKSILKYIHSISIEELSTYGDVKAKQVMLTKLNSYEILPAFKSETDEFFESVLSRYAQDKNGKNDNALLKEVYSGNVGILLTDDNLMLKKAEELYIRDIVITSAELLAHFDNTYPKNLEYKMLAVKLNDFAAVDLNDSFFDTLREDYGGKDFDDWFKRKGKEKAYVFRDEEGLRGFLYVKTELPNESDYLKITPVLSPKKRLKVGTFKIKSSGIRLGERFLKIIFDNARNNHVEEIYVTLFEDKREDVKVLQNLMQQWGFQKHGYKSDTGEVVLVKSMVEYCRNKDPKFNYPLIKEDNRYRFLPISYAYHTDLFPDMILKNEDMHLYEDNLAHRYAIEKIYLTGAYTKGTKPGDILLIYRMGEASYKNYSSVVSGVAIVQEIIPTKNVEDCITKCKDRSIFDEKQIRQIYDKYPTIVKLLDFLPFKHKVTLNELRKNGIVGQFSGPRSFDVLTKENFETIYKLGIEE